MEPSSIYVQCPGCKERTLVQHVGSAVRCAACGFDYAALAQDAPRFEAFLVERMRNGPLETLGAIALHQWLSGLGAKDASTALRALAAKNGVALPEPANPDTFVRRVMIGVALLVAAIVAFLAYVSLHS